MCKCAVLAWPNVWRNWRCPATALEAFARQVVQLRDGRLVNGEASRLLAPWSVALGL
jgi:hypothetical protein